MCDVCVPDVHLLDFVFTTIMAHAWHFCVMYRPCFSTLTPCASLTPCDVSLKFIFACSSPRHMYSANGQIKNNEFCITEWTSICTWLGYLECGSVLPPRRDQTSITTHIQLMWELSTDWNEAVTRLKHKKDSRMLIKN